MSAHPIGFLPQPIASAIGFHMAITTGESTRFSVGPSKSWPVLARDFALPIFTKAAEAGLVMCVFLLPERISSMHSPETMGIAVTTICLPLPVFLALRLNASVTSCIHFSFSEPYVKTSSIEFGGRNWPDAFSPVRSCGFLQLERKTRGKHNTTKRLFRNVAASLFIKGTS